jgi:hypothetical protein
MSSVVGADLRTARRKRGRQPGTGRLGDPALPPTLQSDRSAFDDYANGTNPSESTANRSGLCRVSETRPGRDSEVQM